MKKNNINNLNNIPEQPPVPKYAFKSHFKNDDKSNNTKLQPYTNEEIERLEWLDENAQFQRGSALGDQYH